MKHITTVHRHKPNAPGQKLSGPAEGAHIASDPEGIETVHDSTDPPMADTARGRQLTAALVVGKLLELDLPAIWMARIQSDGITIQLNQVSDAAEIVESLTRWAEFLGAAPRAQGEPYDTTTAGRLQAVYVKAVYRHLSVQVYNGVPVDRVPVEWLADNVTPEAAS